MKRANKQNRLNSQAFRVKFCFKTGLLYSLHQISSILAQRGAAFSLVWSAAASRWVFFYRRPINLALIRAIQGVCFRGWRRIKVTGTSCFVWACSFDEINTLKLTVCSPLAVIALKCGQQSREVGKRQKRGRREKEKSWVKKGSGWFFRRIAAADFAGATLKVSLLGGL